MPRDTFTVTYGQLADDHACDICAEFKVRFGVLIDPNGHTWNICTDCINNFWHGHSFVPRQDVIDARARELIQQRLMGGMGDE